MKLAYFSVKKRLADHKKSKIEIFRHINHEICIDRIAKQHKRNHLPSTIDVLEVFHSNDKPFGFRLLAGSLCPRLDPRGPRLAIRRFIRPI